MHHDLAADLTAILDSTFVITLPLHATAVASSRPAHEMPAASESLDGVRVLVVDDQADERASGRSSRVAVPRSAWRAGG